MLHNFFCNARRNNTLSFLVARKYVKTPSSSSTEPAGQTSVRGNWVTFEPFLHFIFFYFFWSTSKMSHTYTQSALPDQTWVKVENKSQTFYKSVMISVASEQHGRKNIHQPECSRDMALETGAGEMLNSWWWPLAGTSPIQIYPWSNATSMCGSVSQATATWRAFKSVTDRWLLAAGSHRLPDGQREAAVQSHPSRSELHRELRRHLPLPGFLLWTYFYLL